MLEMRIYDKFAGEYKDIEIDPKQVEEFGIYNRKLWNKNGSFKKWDKRVYVNMKGTNERLDSGDTTIIAELEQILKEPPIISKDNKRKYTSLDDKIKITKSKLNKAISNEEKEYYEMTLSILESLR